MGIFNKLFGFRWSLYVVQHGNQLVYAMHENAVLRIIGYVMLRFANGGKPIEPWSLHLNFNPKNQSIKLGPEHFTPDGMNVTSRLLQQIKAIDPGYQVADGEPVCEEVATKRRMKITEPVSLNLDFRAHLDNMNKPRELTFFIVLDKVFGKSR